MFTTDSGETGDHVQWIAARVTARSVEHRVAVVRDADLDVIQIVYCPLCGLSAQDQLAVRQKIAQGPQAAACFAVRESRLDDLDERHHRGDGLPDFVAAVGNIPRWRMRCTPSERVVPLFTRPDLGNGAKDTCPPGEGAPTFHPPTSPSCFITAACSAYASASFVGAQICSAGFSLRRPLRTLTRASAALTMANEVNAGSSETVPRRGPGVAMKILVVDGNTVETNAANQAAGGQSNSVQYAGVLQRLVPEAEMIRVHPSEVGPHCLPSGMALTDFSGVTWTGSALNIYDGGRAIEAQLRLAEAVWESEVPVFGSCWGLQVFTTLLGGRVHKNPQGREIGVARCIYLTDKAQCIIPCRNEIGTIMGGIWLYA